eukprot:636333-Alexandrium_andersonii.AAC.1
MERRRAAAPRGRRSGAAPTRRVAGAARTPPCVQQPGGAERGEPRTIHWWLGRTPAGGRRPVEHASAGAAQLAPSSA